MSVSPKDDRGRRIRRLLLAVAFLWFSLRRAARFTLRIPFSFVYERFVPLNECFKNIKDESRLPVVSDGRRKRKSIIDIYFFTSTINDVHRTEYKNFFKRFRSYFRGMLRERKQNETNKKKKIAPFVVRCDQTKAGFVVVVRTLTDDEGRCTTSRYTNYTNPIH